MGNWLEKTRKGSEMGIFTKNYVESEELKDLKIQVKGLIKEKRTLKDELEDLKLKKRLEQEEIKHMTKLHKQKCESEVDLEKIALKKQYIEKIGDFKEEQRQTLVKSLEGFHTKMEAKFSSELENLKEVLALLMKGLPNVNLEISRHQGDPKFIEKGKK
jgi:hypothetical protein